MTAAASVVVGIAPILALELWWSVPRGITVGYGVIVWVVAVAIKAVIHQLVIDRAVRRGADHRYVSCIHGLLSAFSELGVAAAFFAFLWRPTTLPQLIGIGAGAGMAEAIMLPFIKNPFKGTTLETHSTEVFSSTAGVSAIQWLNVLERVWATLLHASSRALVCLTVMSTNPLPALIGVCGFAAVDGIAYYGHLRKWRFDEIRTLSRVHLFLGGIAALLTGAFVLFARLFQSSA